MATNHARLLASRIKALVGEAQGLFAPSSFQPPSSDRRFVLATSDYAALTLAPALIAQVRSAAPNLTLVFESVRKDTLRELEEGKIDASFCGAAPPAAPWHWQALFQEDHL